jgi:ABC-type transport system involved in cytochrome c biogenesis permease subunit
MLMGGRQAYRLGEEKTAHAPAEWMLDVMAMGLANYYDKMRFVIITDPELVKTLGLEPRPVNRYQVSEFAEQFPLIRKETERISKLPDGQRTPKDEAMFDLALQTVGVMKRVDTAKRIRERLAARKIDESELYWIESDEVMAMLELVQKDRPRYTRAQVYQSRGFDEFRKRAEELERLVESGRLDRKALSPTEAKIVDTDRKLRLEERVASLGGALLIPPPDGKGEWDLLGRVMLSADLGTGSDDPLARKWEKLLVAYGTGDDKKFNELVDEVGGEMEKRYPGETWYASVETWFNHFSPFYLCTILYVVIFLMTCLSWVSWPEALRRAAFWLAVLTLGLQTFGLCLRMYIQGRPPITNLYSTAPFIGWFCLLCCLLLEALFKNGVGNLVGSLIGFATMVISLHLAASGDTLEMMQAVLDTNFWLATHVTTINIGYAATMVAGVIGIVYVVRGVLTTTLDQARAKELATMMYGVICFATLLSFVGTVLGGLWADQSWGRFWGWDPKENGALLIVIMNALILHARWGGMIKDRGMAVLAIVGNMVTMWSWFGTNQLGIGLHAYGFNSALVLLCRWFWVSQLLLIGLALVPRQYWRSSAVAAAPAPTPVRLPLGKGKGKREQTSVKV